MKSEDEKDRRQNKMRNKAARKKKLKGGNGDWRGEWAGKISRAKLDEINRNVSLVHRSVPIDKKKSETFYDFSEDNATNAPIGSAPLPSPDRNPVEGLNKNIGSITRQITEKVSIVGVSSGTGVKSMGASLRRMSQSAFFGAANTLAFASNVVVANKGSANTAIISETYLQSAILDTIGDNDIPSGDSIDIENEVDVQDSHDDPQAYIDRESEQIFISTEGATDEIAGVVNDKQKSNIFLFRKTIADPEDAIDETGGITDKQPSNMVLFRKTLANRESSITDPRESSAVIRESSVIVRESSGSDRKDRSESNLSFESGTEKSDSISSALKHPETIVPILDAAGEISSNSITALVIPTKDDPFSNENGADASFSVVPLTPDKNSSSTQGAEQSTPKQSSTAKFEKQNSSTLDSVPVLRSYRRKARLEQTLRSIPKDMEVVEVLNCVIYKPKITLVTEKSMILRAGAELLTVSLGNISAAGVGTSEISIEKPIEALDVDKKKVSLPLLKGLLFLCVI